MDAFQRYYGVYYIMLHSTGLWPFDNSILTKIQRTVNVLIILSCIALQVNSLKNVEITLQSMLTMLSFTGPMTLFFLRYTAFIINFSLVKSIIQSLQYDNDMLDDPEEVKILLKYIEKSKLIIYIYAGMIIITMITVLCVLLLPMFLHLGYHLQTLQFIGFFYSEYNLKGNLICLNVVFVSTIGIIIISCTEGALSVFSFYLSGLFEIVGYRVRTTIDNAAKLVLSAPMNIGPAVDMHRRACQLSIAVGSNMVVSYLLAIVTVVLSLAVNLYRVLLLTTENLISMEIVICIIITSIHFLIVLLNNYSCQALIDTSTQIFYDTYNSMWYRIPLNSQKMLVFVLMNSEKAMKFNLAGLFAPCYEGFGTMMSSSFSYFTVLYSVK